MNEYRPEYPHISSYLKAGGRTLRNRMCSAPMGFPDLTADGCLTDGAIAFYENRARGGAAVVTISEACVDYENGKSHGRLINLCNPDVLASLTNAARAIKRHGALASIELNHAGMLSDFDVLDSDRRGDGRHHYSASACVLPDGTAVREMTREMIAGAVRRFADGAALCKRAGFDMVMIHAGHGWLLHQFLSPVTNRRVDEYGGCLENRARLALEVCGAVREAVGDGFPIELRFSAMETDEGGWTLGDAIEFAKLAEKKVDILHVSAGTEHDFGITHPPMFAEPGCNVRYAAEIKKHVSIPVATLGALNEPGQMEEIVASGKADIVCMARALLADPELPKKVVQNRADEILRCMRCFVCHAERMLTQTRVCAINPTIGREYEAKFAPPATAPKRVLVAGGGPAGLQCALTAAQRGHDVTLCEKGDRLGGNLKCEYNVPFKASFKKYTETMRRRLELAGAKIRLGTEVTPEFARSFAPDVLIVAVGSEPFIPPVQDIDSGIVISATELETREGEIGRRVIMLGGGLVGCETALHLAKKGHEVTIVEMGPALAPDANPRHRPLLMAELGKAGVVSYVNCRAAAVTRDGLVCMDCDEKNADIFGHKVVVCALKCDTIVCAAGLRPRTELADSLRGTAPVVEVIGDCYEVKNIRGATFRAYHAALDI